MNATMNPTGEKTDHKLAAVFDRREQAESAGESLIEQTSINEGRIEVLTSRSDEATRRLLPDSRGIRRTALRSHLVFGGLGALAGLFLFFLLDFFGVAFVSDNRGLAALVIVTGLLLFGLMVGGFITIRPDHVRYVHAARKALGAGKAVLIVHAETRQELDSAHSLLQPLADETVKTV